MLNLDTLNLLLTDPALRAQVSRLIANKIKSDMQGIRASTELSRHLLDSSRRSRQGVNAENEMASLRDLVKEHLDYYETLVNLSLAFSEKLTERLREIREPTTEVKPSATMRLSVPFASIARAPFRLENNRPTSLSVTFELTPFVTEDGSEIVASKGVFDPPAVELKPGQESRVELILPIAEGFKIGSLYYATISVKGLDAMQIVVHLNVEPPSSVAPQASSTPSPSIKKELFDRSVSESQATGEHGLEVSSAANVNTGAISTSPNITPGKEKQSAEKTKTITKRSSKPITESRRKRKQ